VNNRFLIPALASSMMTPTERQLGRFLRAPDHPGFGGGEPPPQTSIDSSSQTNNTGGNPADSTNGGEGGDNTGPKDGVEGFWDGKPEEADNSGIEEQTRNESTALGTQLKGMIEGFAPPPVFTKEIGEAIAEGNWDAANQAVAAAHRAAITSSVQASAKLISAVVEKLQADIDTRINGALGQKDNTDFLQQNFPQAKDPQLAPVVDRIWNQALVNTKGNRQEAIVQTRGMLRAMGKEFAPEDIRQPAADPTAGIDTPASRSLVENLLSRG
jgi:hypothetical protein